MTSNELQHIILKGENERVEFKQSFSKTVFETVVAFSNHKGGKILIGVNNEGGITGATICEETVQKWINEIKQNTDPSVIPDAPIVEIDNNKIVVLSVNEFPVKPISFKGRFFVRKANSNHKLSADEIAELRFASLNYSFDAFEVNTPFEDLNKNAINTFKEKVKNSSRYKSSGDIENDFKKLGFIKNQKLTRACELLFGKHHTNIHLGRFKSQTTIIDDLMIRSPLILAVEEALDFIKKNIRLGFEFGGDGLQRTERWQFPIPAIRELLLNAIVHRDYSNPTDVIVKIFDESIEITNPGKLMGGLKVEDLYSDDYISRHRNKLTTEAFYLTGDIEKYGTGFKRLREWFSDYPELTFTVKDLRGFIQVKVSSKTDKIKNDPINDPVNDPVNVPVNNRQKLILKLINEDNYITREALAKACNISVETIKRDIRKLRNLNIIKRIGSSKSGYWEVVKNE